MKKTFLLLIAFASINSTNSQNLIEIEQDYLQALRICKEENKLLIIDFYTTWCVPCKILYKTIYQNAEINKTLAKNFVLLKYDAERDSAFRLSMKHHIGSYPTTIVLNPDGNVIQKMYGFGGPDDKLKETCLQFFNSCKESHQQGKFLIGISNQTNLNYPKFYENYVLRTNTKITKEVVFDYWGYASDYKSEVPFAILSYFGGTDSVNNYFLSNIGDFRNLYGEEDIDNVKSRIINQKYSKALELKDRKLLETANQVAQLNLSKDEYSRKKAYMEERMFIAENNWLSATSYFEKRKSSVGFDNSEINNFCWEAYENCNDIEVLKKCTKWMKDYTDFEPYFATLDTYARLLARIKEIKLAKLAMKKAIELGKKEGSDTSDSEDWLKKL